MTDCCIIGGGIIGLSIARELAGRGLSVRVLARDPARDTASWAAAGIFPPAADVPGAPPGDALTAWSDRLHRQWAAELRDETGVDNGLETCGGLHLAGDPRAEARIREELATWRGKAARCELLTAAAVAEVEPALRGAVERAAITGGLLLADETQIRPPRHLEALARSCRSRGVEITPADVVAIDVGDGGVRGVVVRTDGGGEATVRADRYCLAAGAWSGRLAESLGLTIETRPIRGQIALVRLPARRLARIVNVGLDYVVPRADGRLLVGSTIEDAGFAPATTPEAVARLLDLAHRLLGPLPEAVVERAWAGLRPGSTDGLPFIGRVPGCDNAFVAAGHFRAGLHQSTGTAVMLADLLTGRTPVVDPTPFAPDRRPAAASPDSVQAYLARVAAGS
jgi:glycine oxidase